MTVTEVTHTWRFTLTDVKAMRMAVSKAIDSIPAKEGIFYDVWNRLLPELDVKIEKVDNYEKRYGHGR